MCQTCPHADFNRSGSATTCTVNGHRVLSLALSTRFECPVGRYRTDGSVWWRGVEWIGTPEPLRWLLVWKLGREPNNLSGCGCIRAVKESWAGKYLEPWVEGVSLLRARFAGLLTDARIIQWR